MLEFVRSSPLFSNLRLVLCLGLTVFVLTTDVLFIGFKDIQTAADFATEVVIHTLGFYGGYTIVALFNRPSDSG
jgi:hypothetical protein